MAEKKKSTAKSNSVQKKSNAKGKTEVADYKEGKTGALKIPRNPDSPGSQIMLCLIGIIGLLLLVCFLCTDMKDGFSGLTGPVGYGVCVFFYGLFGIGAYLIPIMTFIYAAMWKSSFRRNRLLSKFILNFLAIVFVSSLFHMIFIGIPDSGLSGSRFYDLPNMWKLGANLIGGGVFGALVGGGLRACLNVIAWPVIIIALIGILMSIFELTPNMIAYYIRQMLDSSSEKRETKKAQKEEKEEQKRSKREEQREEKLRIRREREEELLQKEAELRERVNNFSDVKLNGDEKVEKSEKSEKSEPKDDKKDGKKEGGASDTSAKSAENEEYRLITRKNKTGAVVTKVKSSATTEHKTVNDVSLDDVFVEGGAKTASDTSHKNPTDIHGNEKSKIPQESSDSDTAGSYDIELEEEPSDSEQLTDISGNTATGAGTISATREKLLEDDDIHEIEGEEAEKKVYVLPPITLLEEKTREGGEMSEEVLERNAQRLVDTLHSFRVDVEVTNISRGPTITRYELVPKSGVRVRSIANLVDDISLSLESQGVRIEAPIPGKAAVGIEVPNKDPAIVYLRSLIDSDAFRNAKSKLTCCLGRTVSGEPVYLDIAKMPHLLIAGATGSGKSVCINSLLISLLYKATPDEVKLILIDPKKVELGVYNKLPHLLVPVVNQPKMAAGSLAWAVTEMERRFELIEEAGVRNIEGYNKVTSNDPQKEFLPQIVIVIDELADLMMTASDDVETSIVRLAQKARAAGMHLIIGTQRPSVDVITGLIKANVPSRIAFTVASNTDSRTIIDMAGAEKLIGRGDMLYAPVGAMKPIRAQGSFVSDSEVERVTDFIREQMNGTYDDEIIREMDKKAKQCGSKKKSSPSDEGEFEEDLDEKFYEAVECALQEGKVSTSLLQRYLKLGYGRAAKIIDSMQRMRIVSPQDGQKPRKVLITRQDWDEMLMRLEDSPRSFSSSSSSSSDSSHSDAHPSPNDEDGGDSSSSDEEYEEYDDDAPF